MKRWKKRPAAFTREAVGERPIVVRDRAMGEHARVTSDDAIDALLALLRDAEVVPHADSPPQARFDVLLDVGIRYRVCADGYLTVSSHKRGRMLRVRDAAAFRQLLGLDGTPYR